MQGKFVVRMCGCHRQLSQMQTVVVSGRPGAIMVAERIGKFSEKETARAFPEGQLPKDGDFGCFWLYSQGACSFGVGVHWASIGPVHEEA